MAYGNAAGTYREREILTASPAKLVVIVYDHLLANLCRARLAIEANKIEARINAVGKAREAVMELLAGTDVERGGTLAVNLQSLYVFLYSELNVIVHAPDAARVEKLCEIVSHLREAFASVAATNAVQSPAA
jgi:flagellar protein FliS